MLQKQGSLKEDDEGDISDYYEWLRTPKNAPENGKTGVTFKGSADEYFKAHKIVMEMTQKKGDKFVINGTEISIADAPNNKPVSIEVKTKTGPTGKANLKIYGKNKRGTGTIRVN